MGEVKQFDNSTERKNLVNLADLYSIIKATESLEAAYSRGAVNPTEYADACKLLISQFKTTETALVNSRKIVSADSFFREFNIDCSRAYERLVVSGAPATVMHGTTNDNRADTIVVAETVQIFITTMDALKLEQKAVDEIQPLVSDLMSSLNKVPSLPADFEAFTKMRLWLTKLNSMRASDELDEDEGRQLLFDLEASYSAFHKHLSDSAVSNTG